MIIFVLLIAFIVLFPLIFIKEKNRKTYIRIYMILSFIILCIISGFRSKDVGTDTWMYVRTYEKVSVFSDAFKLYTNRFELGYRIYNAAIKVIFNDYHFLLIISTVITLALFYDFFWKKSQSPYLSVIMFVSLMYFCNSMCLMRQYMAVAIGCLAIMKLSEGKRIRFMLYACLAVLFHSSAIVLFVLLLVKHIKINEKNTVKFIIITFIMLIISNSVMGVIIRFLPQYAGYLTSDKYYLQNQIGSILKAAIQCILFILVNIYYRKGITEKSELEKIGYICSLLAMVISIISINGAILSRMAIYFSIVNCVTIPNTLAKIENKQTKNIILYSLIFFCIMYYLVILIYRPQWSGVLPYIFWK